MLSGKSQKKEEVTASTRQISRKGLTICNCNAAVEFLWLFLLQAHSRSHTHAHKRKHSHAYVGSNTHTFYFWAHTSIQNAHRRLRHLNAYTREYYTHTHCCIGAHHVQIFSPTYVCPSVCTWSFRQGYFKIATYTRYSLAFFCRWTFFSADATSRFCHAHSRWSRQKNNAEKEPPQPQPQHSPTRTLTHVYDYSLGYRLCHCFT